MNASAFSHLYREIICQENRVAIKPVLAWRVACVKLFDKRDGFVLKLLVVIVEGVYEDSDEDRYRFTDV